MISRDNLFVAFFFAVFFFLIYQFYLFLSPFAAPLFLAAVLVITFSPLTPRVVRLLRGSQTLAALVMTFGVVLLVLVPLVLMLTLMASEASHFYERVEQIRSEARVAANIAKPSCSGSRPTGWRSRGASRCWPPSTSPRSRWRRRGASLAGSPARARDW